MAYEVVDFDAARKKHEDEAKKAEKAKAGDEQDEAESEEDADDGGDADQEVLEDLEELVQNAMGIENDVHDRISTSFKKAGKLIDEIESLVRKKGKKLTEADLQVVEAKKGEIESAAEEANDADEDSGPALAQWRADFVKGWRALLSDPKLLNSVIAPRAKALKNVATDQQSVKRIGEYVTRAAQIQKLAIQTVRKGDADLAADQGGQIKEFTAEVLKYTKAISDQSVASTKLITTKVISPIELAKKKKLRPDMKSLQLWQKVLVDAEAKAKPIRGQLKTFETLMVTFKKTATMFDSANRKTAQAAYANAAKQFKVAATKAKALSSAQSTGKKAVELAKKNVKK